MKNVILYLGIAVHNGHFIFNQNIRNFFRIGRNSSESVGKFSKQISD